MLNDSFNGLFNGVCSDCLLNASRASLSRKMTFSPVDLSARGRRAAKIIATDPRYNIFCTERFEHFGCLFQQFIARRNAMAIVDREQNSQPLSRQHLWELPAVFKPRHLLFEIGPVIVVGQHIMKAQIQELIFVSRKSLISIVRQITPIIFPFSSR